MCLKLDGINFKKDRIVIVKELNLLDMFVIDGVKVISKVFEEYVIVAGYVSILFGRSRTTEDIDVIIDPSQINLINMEKFYGALESSNYWVFNASSPSSAYKMLREGLSIRVAKKPNVIPNFEIKVARKPLEFEALKNKIVVILNDAKIHISSIELNIAYKLYLRSQKDIEDAVYLYCIFEDKLDKLLLNKYLKQLGVGGKWWKRILRC